MILGSQLPLFPCNKGMVTNPIVALYTLAQTIRSIFQRPHDIIRLPPSLILRRGPQIWWCLVFQNSISGSNHFEHCRDYYAYVHIIYDIICTWYVYIYMYHLFIYTLYLSNISTVLLKVVIKLDPNGLEQSFKNWRVVEYGWNARELFDFFEANMCHPDVSRSFHLKETCWKGETSSKAFLRNYSQKFLNLFCQSGFMLFYSICFGNLDHSSILGYFGYVSSKSPSVHTILSTIVDVD